MTKHLFVSLFYKPSKFWWTFFANNCFLPHILSLFCHALKKFRQVSKSFCTNLQVVMWYFIGRQDIWKRFFQVHYFDQAKALNEIPAWNRSDRRQKTISNFRNWKVVHFVQLSTIQKGNAGRIVLALGTCLSVTGSDQCACYFKIRGVTEK